MTTEVYRNMLLENEAAEEGALRHINSRNACASYLADLERAFVQVHGTDIRTSFGRVMRIGLMPALG